MAATATQNTSKTKLFTLDTSYQGKHYGAPRLIPVNKTGINVTDDFPWTMLPKSTRVNVPSIQMREFRVSGSTLIQSFIQQARSAVDALGGAGDNIVRGIESGLKILGVQITDEEIQKWLNSTIHVEDHVWLDPYKHLYPVKSTDFIYTFPFLTGQNQKTNNSWSVDDKSDTLGSVKQVMTGSVQGGTIGKLLNSAEIFGKTTKVFNIMEPGSHTETIKHYAPSEGESYKVSFTLYNTLKFEDIQKNWELCFILTYQNRSNRRSVSLLDPPVIYSVHIEGVNQFLYAYIEDLEISNLGTSRYVELDNGKKLIPEAYQISFTVKSLLTPTQNLMMYANTGSKIEVEVTP